MKNVHLTERIWYELFHCGVADTFTYRYCVFYEARSCKIKRIRREYVGTTACVSDASDENTHGWEEVKPIIK